MESLVPVVLNLFLFLFILNRNGVRYVDLIVISYYVAFVLGIPGSYLALDGSDWWLRDVSISNIYKSYVIYNITILIFGILIIFRRKTPLKKIYITSNGSKLEELTFLGVVFLTFFVTLFFIFPKSPLAQLLIYRNTDTLLLAELRGSLGVEYSGSVLVVYFKNLVIRYVLPYITIYFCITYYGTGKKKGAYFFSLAILIFCSAIDLSKAPVILTLILVVLTRYMINRISFGSVLRYAITTLVVLALLYMFVMGAQGGAIFFDILHRIFVGQYVGLPATLEVFPRIHPYIDFGSILGSFGKIFGYEYKFYSRINMEFANPGGVSAGTAGYLSTFSLAEGYAMNGVTGYILMGCFLYVFLSLMNSNFSKRNEIKWVAFYILIIFKLPLMIMDSASALIFNYGLLLVYLLIKFVGLINRRSLIFGSIRFFELNDVKPGGRLR